MLLGGWLARQPVAGNVAAYVTLHPADSLIGFWYLGN